MSISNPITDKMAHDLDKALEGAVTKSRDPEKMRAVIDAMNVSREETRQRIGTVNVAVDLIRDARNQ